MAYRSLSYSSRPHTIIVMALVGVLCLGFLSLPSEVRAQGFTIMSERGEIETGNKLDDEIGNKMGFYTEPKLQDYVSEVARRLVRAGSPRSFEYRVKIVDIAEENAFATVGGHVYITRGMLAQLNSETEMAGVLAHEITLFSYTTLFRSDRKSVV